MDILTVVKYDFDGSPIGKIWWKLGGSVLVYVLWIAATTHLVRVFNSPSLTSKFCSISRCFPNITSRAFCVTPGFWSKAYCVVLDFKMHCGWWEMLSNVMYGNLSTFVKGEGHCCLAHSSRLEEAQKVLQKIVTQVLKQSLTNLWNLWKRTTLKSWFSFYPSSSSSCTFSSPVLTSEVFGQLFNRKSCSYSTSVEHYTSFFDVMFIHPLHTSDISSKKRRTSEDACVLECNFENNEKFPTFIQATFVACAKCLTFQTVDNLKSWQSVGWLVRPSVILSNCWSKDRISCHCWSQKGKTTLHFMYFKC